MRLFLIRQCLSIALVAAAAAAAAGCGRQNDGVVEVVVIGGQPRLEDLESGPISAGEAALSDNVAQGLVRLDARGQIEPGLAETWNVSDDGLSYIFRLANSDWPDGKKITAKQVAKMLRRLIGPASHNELRDSFGAVDDVVAMTDRVIEIRLKQPRPHLLQLLAQPEMGLMLDKQGSGPFTVERQASNESRIRLSRKVFTPDEEDSIREQLDLSGATAKDAIELFRAGKADLVIGGTFADLPLAQRANLGSRALQFDPASGLFGLVPARKAGLASKAEVRALLSASIDRDALTAAFAVPALVPRATILEPELDNVDDPAPLEWAATPLADRRAGLVESARQLFAGEDKPVIRLALPEGPGSDILFSRLSQDWGILGLQVERAGKGKVADFKLIDRVAPSTSPAWFLRQFRCEAAAVCDPSVDEILETARTTSVLAQRSALLSEASKRMDSLYLFIPLTAPIRWSLVSRRITGFAGNRYAIHTLTGLEQRLNRTGE